MNIYMNILEYLWQIHANSDYVPLPLAFGPPLWQGQEVPVIHRGIGRAVPSRRKHEADPDFEQLG